MTNDTYFDDGKARLITGDACNVLHGMPPASVDCIVTSPPYFGLRDYGVAGQIGTEKTLARYLRNLSGVFAAAQSALADDGSFWLNLGDTYDGNGVLRGAPWRLAISLGKHGWILRNEVIWHKPNGMPESVKNRLGRKHEHLFLFVKNRDYHFDLDAVREQYTGDRKPSRRAHYGAESRRHHAEITPTPRYTPWQPHHITAAT